MRRIKRIIPLSAAGLALLGISSYFIAFKVAGGDAHDTHNNSVGVQLVSVDLPELFRGYALFDVALADPEMWAVGDNGHDPKLICHSKDKGASWEVVSVPSSGFTLRSISFPVAQNGWAVGGYGTIVHTSDGGRSWEQLKRPTKADLVAVTFINSKVGYVGGSKALFDRANGRYTYGVVILRTTDGGQSWNTCYEDDHSEYVGRIHALSETHALVSVDTLIITEDGGKTWQPVKAAAASLDSVAFTPDGTGYAVSRSGSFYRSLDKGKTWQKVGDVPQSLLDRQWWSIDFADAYRGLAVGSSGAIAFTDDGGKTWREIKTAVQENLMAVRLRGQNGLVLGSQNVYRVERF